LADETPEGRSIVALVRERHGLAAPECARSGFVPFSAQTRMSGLDRDGVAIRKGAVDSVVRFAAGRGGSPRAAAEVARAVEAIARTGGTPLAVARDGAVLGVIH